MDRLHQDRGLLCVGEQVCCRAAEKLIVGIARSAPKCRVARYYDSIIRRRVAVVFKDKHNVVGTRHRLVGQNGSVSVVDLRRSDQRRTGGLDGDRGRSRLSGRLGSKLPLRKCRSAELTKRLPIPGAGRRGLGSSRIRDQYRAMAETRIRFSMPPVVVALVGRREGRL